MFLQSPQEFKKDEIVHCCRRFEIIFSQHHCSGFQSAKFDTWHNTALLQAGLVLHNYLYTWERKERREQCHCQWWTKDHHGAESNEQTAVDDETVAGSAIIAAGAALNNMIKSANNQTTTISTPLPSSSPPTVDEFDLEAFIKSFRTYFRLTSTVASAGGSLIPVPPFKSFYAWSSTNSFWILLKSFISAKSCTFVALILLSIEIAILGNFTIKEFWFFLIHTDLVAAPIPINVQFAWIEIALNLLKHVPLEIKYEGAKRIYVTCLQYGRILGTFC